LAVSHSYPAFETAGRILVLLYLAVPAALRAGDWPYFVTYSHQMEEPGNLEIATQSVTSKPGGGNLFLGSSTELEYGVKGWWTTELYIDAQATRHDSSLFTGYRWENRFRVLPREHWINPVLYIEFENVNGADKSLLEVVNHDGRDDLIGSNAEARLGKKRELEAKLIVSSNVRGWNISENFIAEKNIRHEPFEFGYAVGVARHLAREARPDRCNVCRENFLAGIEVYGGLGTHDSFGLHGTSHYVAPTISWQLANRALFKVSPGFGMTGTSDRFMLRLGISYEIAQFGRSLGRFFHR
jgi:hypothetical protein